MRSTSRRTTKLIGGALFAAAIAATSVATVSNVSADLGEGVLTAQIRVKPTNAAPLSGTSWETQPAPAIAANAVGQAAADVQLLIGSDWESGDIITLQVLADGALGVGHQTNCLDASRSISFTSPNAALAYQVPGGPYTAAGNWGNFDGAMTTAADKADTNAGANNPDIRTPGTQTSVPLYTVSLGTSPSCAGVGVKDLILLTFSNTALVPNSDRFQLTVSGIKYDVGAKVNPGPVHVVPYARTASDGAPGTYGISTIFGGNIDTTLGVGPINMWTNNAFVQPISVAASANTLIADGTAQALGPITLTELIGDGMGHGFTLPAGPVTNGTFTHDLRINKVNLSGAATVAITGNTGATGSASYFNDGTGTTITLTLNNMVATTSGTVSITGLLATPIGNSAGAVVVTFLTTGTATRTNFYLTPDDQIDQVAWTLGDSDYSDVDLPTLSAPFTLIVGVPGRIGGSDRYETSSKIAASVSTCTEWAVVASGSSYPDALSANFLAGTLANNTPDNVPVLLVGTDSIPSSVSAYMNSAGVKHVYIVGGTAAVSAAVAAALDATSATKCTGANNINSSNPVPNQTLDVVRIAGATRYDTNRAVVNTASAIFPFDNRNLAQLEFGKPARRTAIVATGSNFADALSAGSITYDEGFPLILTDGTSLSASAAAALTDNDISQVIVLGGSAAVSDGVVASIVALMPNCAIVAPDTKAPCVVRIGGSNRYATATAIATFTRAALPVASVPDAFDGGLAWSTRTVFLASGVSFADALSAGPLAATWGPWGPTNVVLTEPAALSADTNTWLSANSFVLDYVVTLGLGSAVSTAAVVAANAAISLS